MIARVIAARISRYFDSDSIHERLEFLEAKETALAKQRERAERKPWFCSGCPHNTSTVVPEGSIAMGGIGCHYMATWMDRGTETFTQMGGEGATWLGQAPFTERKHVFQNLGDGTYFHSGLLAIRAAVASGVNITYKILYNDAVAMTGGQPLDGELSVAQIVAQLRAEGVNRIALVSDEPEIYRAAGLAKFTGVSIAHRNQLGTIQLELRDTEGCTALIYAQTCAAEKRRRRKKGILVDPPKRIFINDAVCEGCGDCGVQSNCLSIIPKQTPFGRKRAIDQSACNKDYSCVRGFCPSFVSVHGGQLRKHQAVSQTRAWTEPAEPQRIEVDGPFNILITGIGGTGILTVGSILGMAAHIEHKGVSVLNQTGLAQKFGAVTGHVRISAKQADINAMRIPAGEAHLLLGADLTVSAGDDALAKLNHEHSYAVINHTLSSTAEFTRNPDAEFPLREMEQTITEETRDGRSCFVDATTIASRLLGDAIFANFFLLGVAYQHGLIPIGAAAIAEAIELNGVAVDKNRQAFLWGRRQALDPSAVMRAAGLDNTPVEQPATESLADLISRNVNFLTDYQNQAYADRYLRLVEAVRRREGELQPSPGHAEQPLTRAVAQAYHKLLAYKDEYEVARLFSNGDFEKSLDAQFEGDYRLSFHLAPPLLAKRDPVTGTAQKREFGGWMLGMFRLLARFRGLRGGMLDIFGYSEERKLERALISRYEQDVDLILTQITTQNLTIAVEMASLPLKMRGFGHVKLANIEQAQRRGELLSRQLTGRDLAVELFSP
jgi:indolepyruvate ferredoxin oxidoreductase